MGEGTRGRSQGAGEGKRADQLGGRLEEWERCEGCERWGGEILLTLWTGRGREG